MKKEAINEGIPYADSFLVECVYCVTKVTDGKSRLKVHGGITFKKYIFGLIKSKSNSPRPYFYLPFIFYNCAERKSM